MQSDGMVLSARWRKTRRCFKNVLKVSQESDDCWGERIGGD